MTELLGLFVLGGPLTLWFLFFLIALVVLFAAIRAGRRHGRPWGRWTAIAIALFILWDLPLVRGIFHYRCATEAGFTEYRTPAAWLAENGDEAESLAPIEKPVWIRDGNVTRVPINERLAWAFENSESWFDIRRREDRIEDTATGEVLARYVDFSAGRRWNVENFFHPRAYKFWLDVRSCEADGEKRNRSSFFQFKHEMKHIGR